MPLSKREAEIKKSHEKIISQCFNLVSLWSRFTVSSEEFAAGFNCLCRMLQDKDIDRFRESFFSGRAELSTKKQE